MADIKQYVKAAEEKMTFAIEYLDEQLSHIRAGKANPKILDCVRVMYYGAPVPLTNVATVTVPDARTIMITPWEKKIIKDIEKGIMDSEVGITPENNGEVIRLGIPPLTEERRRLLAKQSKQEAETAKISIRNARRARNTGTGRSSRSARPATGSRCRWGHTRCSRRCARTPRTLAGTRPRSRTYRSWQW